MRSLSLLTLLSVLALALLFPNPSSAGEYDVSACAESVGYVNNSWRSFDSNSQYLEIHAACHEAPTHELSANLSNLAVGDVMEVGDPSVGVEAGWRFTAPAGTTIGEVKGSDDLFKNANNDWQIYLRNANDEVLGGQTCTVELVSGLHCEVSGIFQASGLDTLAVSIGVLCTENGSHNCPDGATIHDVRAELDYVTVTIRDELAPTSVGSAQLPSGPQHGTVSVLGSAVDRTAGLLSLSVIDQDGEVVGGPVGASGACNYSFVTPCPIEVNDLAIPVDTTKLPNGEDKVRVEATNAAHDEGFSSPYTITIENGSPKQEGSTGYPSGGEPGSESKSSGSNLNESNDNPGNSGSSQISSGEHGGQLTPVTKPPLPALQLKTKATRSIDGELLISGLVSRGATGALDLVAHGIVRGHRLWTYKATVAIKRGRFRLKLRLPKVLNRRTVEVSLSYPGSLFFGPTKVLLSARVRRRRTGK